MQVSAMKKIFDFNVMKFGAARWARPMAWQRMARSSTNARGKRGLGGNNVGNAALLMSEGMKDEAWKTAWGLYHVIYETKGYWFRTPEAWDITGNFRASMYMRPWPSGRWR